MPALAAAGPTSSKPTRKVASLGPAGAPTLFAGLASKAAPLPTDVAELLRDRGLAPDATTYERAIDAGTSVFVASQTDRLFLVLYQRDTGRATFTFATPEDAARRGLMLSTGINGEAGGRYAALVPDSVKSATVIDQARGRTAQAAASNIIYAESGTAFTVTLSIEGAAQNFVVNNAKG